jgi:Domain of unknown function (DUF4440)
MKMTRALPAILLCGALLATYGLQAFSQDAAVHLPEGLEMDRPGPKNAAEQQIEKDILGFQAELKAAAIAKDRSKVESLFAPDATVTLATGQVTDKQGRIEQILGPGPAFERMDYANQTVRALGDKGAVAIVDTTIFTRPTPDHPKGIIRVMVVYRKGRVSEGYHGWQMVSLLGIFIPAKDIPGA